MAVRVSSTISRLTHSLYTTKIAWIRRYTMSSSVFKWQDLQQTISACEGKGGEGAVVGVRDGGHELVSLGSLEHSRSWRIVTTDSHSYRRFSNLGLLSFWSRMRMLSWQMPMSGSVAWSVAVTVTAYSRWRSRSNFLAVTITPAGGGSVGK